MNIIFLFACLRLLLSFAFYLKAYWKGGKSNLGEVMESKKLIAWFTVTTVMRLLRLLRLRLNWNQKNLCFWMFTGHQIPVARKTSWKNSKNFIISRGFIISRKKYSDFWRSNFFYSAWATVKVSEANKCFENFLTSYFSNSLIYVIEEPTRVVHILDTAFIYNEKLLRTAVYWSH